MKPYISVVIPTYNHAHFLKNAIQSVLDQKYENWEALVVDNHSDDNTDEVVLGFDDKRIKLLKTHNYGVIAKSRNLGIKKSKGDWIAFLDSDDCWYPTKLKTVIDSLENNLYDVVSTDELMVNQLNGKQNILRYGPYTKNFYEAMLLYGNRFSTSATIVRRSFLINKKLLFREDDNFVTVEDYDFWLRIAMESADFLFLRSVEGEYNLHGNNSSKNVVLHKKNNIAVLKDHVFKLQNFNPNLKELWSKVNSRLHVESAIDKVRCKEYYFCVKLMIKAIIISPSGFVLYIATKSFYRFSNKLN
jgi:glycosyltransferase involved in cell wall biosynthesis